MRRLTPEGARRPAVQRKRRHAMRRQARKIARHPLFGHSPALQPADKGYVTRAAGHQMCGGQRTTKPIIRGGKREMLDARINLAQHLHHRNPRAQKRVKGHLFLPIGRRNHHRGHAMFDHRGDDLALQRRVLIGVGNHRRIATRRQGHLDRGGKLGKERVPQIIDHQPDQPDLGRPQIGRVAIVDVTQFLHHPQHGLTGFGLHGGILLEHQRDGRFRHPGHPRHIDDGGPARHAMPCNASRVAIRRVAKSGCARSPA